MERKGRENVADGVRGDVSCAPFEGTAGGEAETKDCACWKKGICGEWGAGSVSKTPSELEVTRRRNLPHFAASNHVSRSAVIGPTT